MLDNATLIGFLNDNLPLLLRNKHFDFNLGSFAEQDDSASWTVGVKRSDVAFDVSLKYFPATDSVILHPADDDSLVQTFSDKHEITTRIELLYFNRRFDNFLPLELDVATKNKVILENVVRICRFVEDKFLEGRLKKCNVIWDDIHLLCEFMFEGNIRGVAQNSWFLSLEYYPQLSNTKEFYMVSCDGIEADDEGMEREATKLSVAIAVIEERLSQLP